MTLVQKLPELDKTSLKAFIKCFKSKSLKIYSIHLSTHLRICRICVQKMSKENAMVLVSTMCISMSSMSKVSWKKYAC